VTVANTNPGVCVNDLTDHLLLDELSGASALTGCRSRLRQPSQCRLRAENAQNGMFRAQRLGKCHQIDRHSYSAIRATPGPESNHSL
jgi:hypothetical protein